MAAAATLRLSAQRLLVGIILNWAERPPQTHGRQMAPVTPR
uniref:Zinc finger protein 814 n=1 Tax=Mandrillus leucophaeus TaxID=9568 RepID=A0A2K5YFJ2_MANLE